MLTFDSESNHPIRRTFRMMTKCLHTYSDESNPVFKFLTFCDYWQKPRTSTRFKLDFLKAFYWLPSRKVNVSNNILVPSLKTSILILQTRQHIMTTSLYSFIHHVCFSEFAYMPHNETRQEWYAFFSLFPTSSILYPSIITV